jgi:bla regulator protein blaR1
MTSTHPFAIAASSAWAFPGWPQIARLLGDHLWQSTLFAALAGLLTLAFRINRAQVRNALWLAASVKVLIPFAALVAIGAHFGWRRAAPLAQTPASFAFDVDTMTQPFSRLAAATPPAAASHSMVYALPFLFLAVWLCGCAAILFTWWTCWRRVALAIRKASPVTQGPELDALRRLEAAAGITKPVAFLASDTSLEPGVFGIARPVLLWPRSIAQRLTGAHVEMILAHELSHVRRRDNLAAAIHMFVEALFWFHPLVWWIGARMVEERERACDEDVLRSVGDPQSYAESVLKVCEFYLESPLTCVSGVTGSNLKKRMERIMSNRVGETLNGWRKLFLAAAAVAALAVPIVVGMLIAPRLLAAQSPAVPGWQVAAGGKMAFDVASVKPNKATGRPISNIPLTIDDTFAPTGGLFSVTGATLRGLMVFAYKTQQMPVGFPGWGSSDRFDIQATAQGNTTKDQMRLMMQSLLADRFKLSAHFETRQIPVYALVLSKEGKTGPQLKPDDGPCSTSPADIQAVNGAPQLPPSSPSAASQHPQIPCGALMPVPPSASGRMRIAGIKVTTALLVRMMTNPASGVDRPVLDRTGLTGTFDMDFVWAPRPNGPPPPGFTPDPDGPTFFEAIQDALGLKLQPQTGPVDVLVIDHVEQPLEN